MPSPRQILDDTRWNDLDTAYFDSSGDEVLACLIQLTSGDRFAVEAGIRYLHNALFECPNLFSAAVPAARYVAALLGDPVGRSLLSPDWDDARQPVRARLADWLAWIIEEVSDENVSAFTENAGFSPLSPGSSFQLMRESRPELLAAISAERAAAAVPSPIGELAPSGPVIDPLGIDLERLLARWWRPHDRHAACQVADEWLPEPLKHWYSLGLDRFPRTREFLPSPRIRVEEGRAVFARDSFGEPLWAFGAQDGHRVHGRYDRDQGWQVLPAGIGEFLVQLTMTEIVHAPGAWKMRAGGVGADVLAVIGSAMEEIAFSGPLYPGKNARYFLGETLVAVVHASTISIAATDLVSARVFDRFRGDGWHRVWPDPPD